MGDPTTVTGVLILLGKVPAPEGVEKGVGNGVGSGCTACGVATVGCFGWANTSSNELSRLRQTRLEGIGLHWVVR